MGHVIGFIILFILAGLVLVGAVLVAVVKAFRASPKHNGSEEEARMIQEMYAALSRMEDRVESLETLLLEKENKS